LTQRSLAEQMHLSDQTIANYEKNNTRNLGPADPLMRIQFLLRVIPDETRAEILKLIADAERGQKLPDVPRRKIVQSWQETLPAAA